MLYYLTVLFLINGEATQIEGFHPRLQESLDICEERAKVLEKYIRDNQKDFPELYEVTCKTQKRNKGEN